ncbi:Two-component response regulator-like [Stylosanthes scabra]|uniref:Two-component response regulator-like n=1 Tax=Stylosanthes scabra TaxID=79078 RepID=A0ABU6T8H5_9FABA|nr:Two-component response regulator-like [Stylosanthes scabra]
MPPTPETTTDHQPPPSPACHAQTHPASSHHYSFSLSHPLTPATTTLGGQPPTPSSRSAASQPIAIAISSRRRRCRSSAVAVFKLTAVSIVVTGSLPFRFPSSEHRYHLQKGFSLQMMLSLYLLRTTLSLRLIVDLSPSGLHTSTTCTAASLARAHTRSLTVRLLCFSLATKLVVRCSACSLSPPFEYLYVVLVFRGQSDDAKPAMVCTANDLHGWKDFLKGLRVLLLERDNTSACEIRAKLEAMDYNGEVNFSLSRVLKFSSNVAKMSENEKTRAWFT